MSEFGVEEDGLVFWLQVEVTGNKNVLILY